MHAKRANTVMLGFSSAVVIETQFLGHTMDNNNLSDYLFKTHNEAENAVVFYIKQGSQKRHEAS